MTPSGLFVGLATLDVVQLVDGLPGRNQKIAARRTWLAAGGPAAVGAITFAALGGRARLWTALGGAPAARLVADDLAAAGVEVVDAAPDGFELAASTVFVEAVSGERSVVSGSGAVPGFAALGPVPLDDAGVVLLDGHHAPLARAAASGASAARVPVVLDAGSHKPVFDDVFAVARDVICSADYVHPAGLGPGSLLGLGPELVAISHGGGPLEWRTREASGSVRPPPVIAVDTTGAGDVLHGAYCYGLASGLDRVAALEFGVAIASERVRYLGPVQRFFSERA